MMAGNTMAPTIAPSGVVHTTGGKIASIPRPIWSPYIAPKNPPTNNPSMPTSKIETARMENLQVRRDENAGGQFDWRSAGNVESIKLKGRSSR